MCQKATFWYWEAKPLECCQSTASLNCQVNLLSPHGRSPARTSTFLTWAKIHMTSYTCWKLQRYPDVCESRSRTTPLSQSCGPSWEAQQHFGEAEYLLQIQPACPVASYNIHFNHISTSGPQAWVTGWCAMKHVVWQIRLINQPFWPQKWRFSSKLYRDRTPDIISKPTNMTQTSYF